MNGKTPKHTKADKPAQSTADTARPEFVFDGVGINGPDEFRTRVATFTTPEHALQYGQRFETALRILTPFPSELTLTDAIDAFPILRGMRAGIGSRPGDRAPYLSDWASFVSDAVPLGSGAVACAWFIIELCGVNPGENVRRFNWPQNLAKLDSEHRAALAFVITRWIRGGGF